MKNFNVSGYNIDEHQYDLKPLQYMKDVTRKLYKFGLKNDEIALVIDVSEQKLYVIKNYEVIKAYSVSTSKYGTGNIEGSNKTPLGMHKIVKKIGENKPIGTIIVGGKALDKKIPVYELLKKGEIPDSLSFMTTRALRLQGLEEKVNVGLGVDTYQRHIYIHGTPYENLIGKPSSNGCIRMKNKDIIELFKIVKEGTLVYIIEKPKDF